jgi:serine/threonine protein kinase
MGVVWQARDELLSRDVAVKELFWPAHFSAAEQQTASRRATREARLAGRLNHRNVIRVFDIAEEDGRPWIVMELLPCPSLRELIEEEGPLSPAEAAVAGLAILAALQAAHAEGIVHRDVKPANILMAADRVVLTDFGIARPAGPSGPTTVGELIGSPAYIAPERARGGRSGPAGDLWGLGATLYAAVEGHSPFEREGDALASLTAVVADEPAPTARAGPLWPVISGLLRKDPDERLDAAQAERMLRDASAAPAVVPGTMASSRPRQPRGPAVVLVTAGALVVIAASGAVAGLSLANSARHEPTAASTPSAAASPRALAPSTHSPTAITRPGTTASTHVPARKSGAHAPGSSSRPTTVTIGSTTGKAGSGTRPAARRPPHPPGHATPAPATHPPKKGDSSPPPAGAQPGHRGGTAGKPASGLPANHASAAG